MGRPLKRRLGPKTAGVTKFHSAILPTHLKQGAGQGRAITKEVLAEDGTWAGTGGGLF